MYLSPKENPFPGESSPYKAFKYGFFPVSSLYIYSCYRPRTITGVYIERRIEEKTLQTALEGEDSPGKGFSLGENYFRKWGLAIFWGSQVS